MTVTVYRSSDSGAPAIDGQVGSLITVLDAILVNGYGAKSPAGWTKAFSGTNGADYRQGSGSNQYYMDINDNGPGTHGGREARMVGYEAMTGFQTGTNLFPTVAQMATGVFVRKSAVADATTRPWIALADQRTLYMFIQSGDTAGVYLSFMFGEFYSVKASDLGRTMVVGRITEANAGAAVERFDVCSTAVNVATTGHYMARAASGAVGSMTVAKFTDSPLANTTGLIGLLEYKNSADNQIYLAPVRVANPTTTTFRGRLRGLYAPLHAATNFSDGDTFSGAGDFLGKSFMAIKATPNGSVYIVEVSNTWDTNS